MDFAYRLAEERIRAAMAEGAFDNLEGKGKPLPQSDDKGIPEDLRMTYKILKNAQVLPEELEQRKQIINLEALIAACEDEQERKDYYSRLTAARLRFDIMMEKRAYSPGAYRDAIKGKLGL